VFVALSLLVVTMFSSGADMIGFSDSLGAFIAGIVLADSPYAHRIIKELQTFKSLFLSLFFVTVGTTIDLGLVKELLPVALVMAGTLMATKVGIVAASGGLVGLTWQEALLAGAFVSQGGEFAFVIFGQVAGVKGALFPTDLDRLLVVVVVLSMMLTPLVVDLCFKIVGQDLVVLPCPEKECASAAEFSEKFFLDSPLSDSNVKEQLERALTISGTDAKDEQQRSDDHLR
jgi:Kef-type K+ transport system membrane component KefB